MGENIVGSFTLGTIQNGKFVPIGKFDSIETFEDTSEKFDDNNSSIRFTNDYSYEFTCNVSKRSRKNFELLFIYGWRNKMPFRRRTLKKALRNKINSNLRWFA